MTQGFQKVTWKQPQQRITWAEAHALVRRDNLARSTAILTDDSINDAIDRAVAASWPRCFEQHLLQVDLDGYAGSLTFPWEPEDVVLCAWTDLRNTALPLSACDLAPALWSNEGNLWRYLGSPYTWPTSTVSLAVEIIIKPRQRGDGPDESPLYCTIDPKYLLPLAKLELVEQIAVDEGKSMVDAMNAQERFRMTVIERLPRMKRPQSVLSGQRSVSTVIWHHWDQEDVYWDQLG